MKGFVILLAVVTANCVQNPYDSIWGRNKYNKGAGIELFGAGNPNFLLPEEDLLGLEDTINQILGTKPSSSEEQEPGNWSSHHVIEAWQSFKSLQYALMKARFMGMKARDVFKIPKVQEKKRFFNAANNAKTALNFYMEAARFAEEALKVYKEVFNMEEAGEHDEGKIKALVNQARIKSHYSQLKADEALHFEILSEEAIPYIIQNPFDGKLSDRKG